MSQAGIALKFLKPDEVNPKDPSPAGALLADMVKTRLTEYWTDRGGCRTIGKQRDKAIYL